MVANDEDPDGDALMVTEITGVPEGTRVAVTADQGAVQVIPAPGVVGTVAFAYTVSDGRGATASARRDRRGVEQRRRQPAAGRA